MLTYDILKTILNLMLDNGVYLIDEVGYNDDLYYIDKDAMDLKEIYELLLEYTYETVFEKNKHKYVDYFKFSNNEIIVAIRMIDSDGYNDYITLYNI